MMMIWQSVDDRILSNIQVLLTLVVDVPDDDVGVLLNAFMIFEKWINKCKIN